MTMNMLEAMKPCPECPECPDCPDCPEPPVVEKPPVVVDPTPTPVPPSPGDWQAEAPRSQVDIIYRVPVGRTIEVRTAAELQTAINNYGPDDQIVVMNDITTPTTFVLTRPGRIVIRGHTLTPPNVRVTPASAAAFPKIKISSASSVFSARAGVELRLVCLTIGAVDALTTVYTLVSFGEGNETALTQLPKNCVLDRCWVYGHDNLDVRRGVGLQGIDCAVVDSWISGIHSVFDACAVMGWNGPGPYGVYNSYLEASGENWMFGGADSKITNTIPSDVTLDRNHMFKPVAWNTSRWQLKNLGEAKSVRRFKMSRCLSENNTVSTQPGYAMVLSATDQERLAPWSTVEDVIMEWNEWKNVIGFSNLVGWTYDADRFWTRRVSIRNNLIRPLATGLGVANILQRHLDCAEFVGNTFERSDYLFMFEGNAKADGGLKGLRFINNAAATWTPFHIPDGLTTFDTYAPGRIIQGNTFVSADQPIPTGVGVDRVKLAEALAGVVVSPTRAARKRK
jgi:hypothetical protein